MDEIKEKPEDAIDIIVRILLHLFYAFINAFFSRFLSRSQVLEGKNFGLKWDEAPKLETSKHPVPNFL